LPSKLLHSVASFRKKKNLTDLDKMSSCSYRNLSLLNILCRSVNYLAGKGIVF
jgi:hypothetical protein